MSSITIPKNRFFIYSLKDFVNASFQQLAPVAQLLQRYFLCREFVNDFPVQEMEANSLYMELLSEQVHSKLDQASCSQEVTEVVVKFQAKLREVEQRREQKMVIYRAARELLNRYEQDPHVAFLHAAEQLLDELKK